MADIVTATDDILAALRTIWLAESPAIVGSMTAPVLVFEALEKDLKPHPKDGSKAWARLTVRHASGRAAALGNRRFRRTGTVHVQIFVPFKDGSAYTVAQRLARVAQKAYEGERAGAVTFNSVATPERGVEGSWYRIDCLASFSWDEVN